MKCVEQTNTDLRNPHFLFTCEHAGNELFGTPHTHLDRKIIDEHWGYDIGALALTRALGKAHKAPTVSALFSRLLTDPNRPPSSPSFIVEKCEGVTLSFNKNLSHSDRQKRQSDFYDRYHRALNDLIVKTSPKVLVSVHSFTPLYLGQKRDIEIGVLYEDHASRAEALTQKIAQYGFDARNNEPYSGALGLMYSVQEAGRKHGLAHVELEVRNDLLSNAAHFYRVLSVLSKTLPPF